MGRQPYTRRYYETVIEPASRSSANEIVPLLMKMVAPKSVIDVGCGTGSWLAAFRKHGVEDVWGVDGAHVEPASLQIPRDRFTPWDLTRPFSMNRKFDLVMSLEVAEHLPAEAADTFVETLAGLGSVILFSAAIPFQGGVHHVNEQWQDYWAEKFESRGFKVVDALRKQVWTNPRVEWYYAQNALMYARPEAFAELPKLEPWAAATCPQQLRVVHPSLFLEANDLEKLSLRKVLKALPAIFSNTVKSRLRR